MLSSRKGIMWQSITKIIHPKLQISGPKPEYGLFVLKTFYARTYRYLNLLTKPNKLKRPSLALLRCKLTFEIFELGLIAVQNDISNFLLGLIAVQIELFYFRAWPYCGANLTFKFV